MNECECKDPLFGLDATRERAEQLTRTFNFLLKRLDVIHTCLCPNAPLLIWQARVEQAVAAAEKIAKDPETKGGK